MMIFCDGFDRVARELETSELQLALHDGGRRDVWEGLSGVLEVGDVVLSGLVERHEGAQEFGERSGHGDVVVRGTRLGFEHDFGRIAPSMSISVPKSSTGSDEQKNWGRACGRDRAW